MSNVKLREKIFLFKRDDSQDYQFIQAVNLLTACKLLYQDLNNFSFTLIAIF